MLALLGVMAACAAVGFKLAQNGTTSSALLPVFLTLLGIAFAMVLTLMYQVQRHLLAPLTQLYTWALRMCDGDLSARIVSPQTGQFAKLTFHINRLSEALDRLANEMDDMVWEQTERLQQKNQSLELLYEIAAAINTSAALEHLLERSAEKLLPCVGGDAATIHLYDENNELQMLKSVGAVDVIEQTELDHGMTGGTLAPSDSQTGDVEVAGASGNGGDQSRLTVPLRYQERSLGMLNLYTSKADIADDIEVRRLLISVGKHLGMAIAKSRLDQESKNLSLMRERTSLAYELHDSLAQTIAALRFQIRNLSETLDREELREAKRELKRIDGSLDEVNTEVRDLIANFRAPIDERGLLPALEEMVGRFRGETGITTYFQAECQTLHLSVASELQLLGIIREALTNIRKHSHAKTVRVLLRCGGDGYHRVLVEDDGVGIEQSEYGGHPGEHIGLSIMSDRARRLGGKLRVDSEPGEGTRVDLTFKISAGHERREAEARVG
jgi:two-component system nitrate/nitrite sensor histidine kinase NarX